MYHIFAAERHRQDGARGGENQPPLLAAADAPCGVEPLAPVEPGILGVDQQFDAAGAAGGFDLVGAAEQRAAARFEAEAVERRLAQRGLDPLAEIGGDGRDRRS